ncbi:MAG: hypothetical protein M1570_05810 [Chloroflexi bacterium]|nr:hypothetical protein [Chloroflexota bacterium]
MRIVECCPFYNESLVARAHIAESSRWVDEIHIVESNWTFQYAHKGYAFENTHPKVHYHAVDTTHQFKRKRSLIPYLDLQHRFSQHGFFRNPGWYNEMVQRNLACKLADIQDDDIVVLSDIDEIVDSQQAERLLTDVKKHEIITVRLHFTMFYFNLFSSNWGGPADYAYRTFMLTGRRLREEWRFDSDRLRKHGEHGKLRDGVYCPDMFSGFHHSWLGDESAISGKLTAYAHAEHSNLSDPIFIRQRIHSKSSIFAGHDLVADNTIPLLQSVEALRPEFPQYFI